MLFGSARSVRARTVRILLATVTVTLGGILLAALGGVAGLWGWPPQPSSVFGVACGFLAGAIVLFEMALLPRKWLRGRRLGATRVWMRWHVWLGLVCVPVTAVHAGFAFGGPLTTVLLSLFLLVSVSGVWGLILQQWLPRKLLAEVPGETVASQVGYLGEYHATEATRLVEVLILVPPESDSVEPVVVGPPARELTAFRDDVLLPYLRNERHAGSPLAARSEAERYFSRLRTSLPVAAHANIDRLQQLADLRRQWDTQVRLNFWLHNWLVVHLPASVLMTGLMVAHAFRALKYW